jgi:hypothetical protein
MKAVLLSIKPEYCELIAKGKKTIEIRKTKPKLKTPFKCYIYETKAINHQKILVDLGGNLPTIYAKGSGKVIGEFVCDGILDLHDNGKEFVIPLNREISELLMPLSCLSYKELRDYANGKQLYGWHIADLKIYDEPKELWELYKPGFEAMEDLDCDELCRYCYRTDYGSKGFGVTPNGYYSCEGNWCGEAYESYLEDNFAVQHPPQGWCYIEEQEDT